MATIIYISRCQWCGKTGSTAAASSSGNAPKIQPNVSGICKASPSGNGAHAPRWELK